MVAPMNPAPPVMKIFFPLIMLAFSWFLDERD
jgi:hypothetical protein